MTQLSVVTFIIRYHSKDPFLNFHWLWVENYRNPEEHKGWVPINGISYPVLLSKLNLRSDTVIKTMCSLSLEYRLFPSSGVTVYSAMANFTGLDLHVFLDPLFEVEPPPDPHIG